MSEALLYSKVNDTRRDVRELAALVSSEMMYLKKGIDVVNNEVLGVKNDMQRVKEDVYSFRDRFEAFVALLEKENNITHAQGRIVILNQEIEKQFGLYEDVRNNFIGILQAVDTGLVSKRIITNSTEELMLGTPRYWLSPSLVAVSAWMNNNQTLAYKAVNEAIKRNPIKTELIFVLISNRLKRQDASFAWLSKFFETQNPLAMPQETLILLNAYTDGVFGPDSQGMCTRHISKWMDVLSKQPEVIKDLEKRWIQKIKLMPISVKNEIPFKYLEKYSPNFTALMDLLSDARKHEVFLNYLKNIMTAPKERKDYVEELDDILFKLVKEYDEDEFELRKERRLCELIVKYDGDKRKAQADFEANVVMLFKNKMTFFEILVKAASQEDFSPNLRKLAILLMKEWILNAHQDFTAQYRMTYPAEVAISMDHWTDNTQDGSNVKELSVSYRKYLKEILDKELTKIKPSFWVIGIMVACLCWLVAACNADSITFFLISLMVLGWNLSHVRKERQKLKQAFEQKCDDGTSIINACCAEYVDWQKAYKDADARFEEVPNFLSSYSTTEFSSNSAAKKIIF